MTIAVPLGHDQYNYLWRFSDQEATVSGDVTCGSLNGIPQTCTFAAEIPLGEATHNVVPKISAMVPVVAAFREKPDQDNLGISVFTPPALPPLPHVDPLS